MPPLYAVPNNGWTFFFSWRSADSAIRFCLFADWIYLATAAKGTDNYWLTLDSIQSLTGTKRQKRMRSAKNNLYGLYQSLVLHWTMWPSGHDRRVTNLPCLPSTLETYEDMLRPYKYSRYRAGSGNVIVFAWASIQLTRVRKTGTICYSLVTTSHRVFIKWFYYNFCKQVEKCVTILSRPYMLLHLLVPELLFFFKF